MAQAESKSEILARLERGEISAQSAILALADGPQAEPESSPPSLPVAANHPGPVLPSLPDGPSVQTRRERLFAATDRVRDWDPRNMVTLSPPPRPGPWPDGRYQWLWQDFDHPVHVDHALDLADGSGLSVVVYEGDLNMTGDEGSLRIGAAAFDLRIGRDEHAVRMAAATGTLDLRVPRAVARIEARALPGDLHIRGLRLQQLRVDAESGDLRCEDVRGDIGVRVHGGDADLRGIDGDGVVTVSQGNIRVREVRSNRLHLVAGGGISLTLDAVDRGEFRCESTGGDVELVLAGEASCNLSAEAREGGTLCPSALPWTDLTERSSLTLKGTLGNGGASIHLATSGGRIYITNR